LEKVEKPKKEAMAEREGKHRGGEGEKTLRSAQTTLNQVFGMKRVPRVEESRQEKDKGHVPGQERRFSEGSPSWYRSFKTRKKGEPMRKCVKKKRTIFREVPQI